MEVIETIYLVSFFTGFFFVVLSAIFGGLFSADHMGEGVVDLGHDGGVGDGGGFGHALHFPILSPITISFLIASFGGMGIIYSRFLQLPAALHIPGAAASAVAMTALCYMVIGKLFGGAEGTSSPREDELIGIEAQVGITIPPEGTGQIVYSVAGIRYTAPARSSDRSEIKTGSTVKVDRIEGGVFYVSRVESV